MEYRTLNKSHKMKSVIRFTAAETGMNLLEFALLLPLLLLIVAGVVDIGRAAYMSMIVSHGATAGVEYGAQNSKTAADSAGMKAAATQDATVVTTTNTTAAAACGCDNGTGNSCNPLPTSACNSSLSCPGGQILECVKVTTHASFDPLLPWPGLPSSYQANGSAVMRVRP